MKDEQVLLCEGADGRLCPVNKIVVPDIRFQGLFVGRQEQAVLNFAFEAAVKVRRMILRRERDSSHREKFIIDIPDLWFIATQTVLTEGNLLVPALRRELRNEIVVFTMTFQSLVRHFLPKSKQTGYSYDGRTQHGVKYQGYAWVSDSRR